MSEVSVQQIATKASRQERIVCGVALRRVVRRSDGGPDAPEHVIGAIKTNGKGTNSLWFKIP